MGDTMTNEEFVINFMAVLCGSMIGLIIGVLI